MNKKPSVLIVDDAPFIRMLLTQLLEDENYEVDTAENGELAEESVKNKKYDIVCMDLRMPGISGIETIEKIRQIDKGVPIAIITGYGDDIIFNEAKEKYNVFAMLDKPFDEDKLLEIIKDGINLSQSYA